MGATHIIGEPRQGLAALQSSLDRPAEARLDGGGTSRVQGKGDGGWVLSAPVRACPVTLQKLPSRESAVNSRGAGSGGVTSEPLGFLSTWFFCPNSTDQPNS